MGASVRIKAAIAAVCIGVLAGCGSPGGTVTVTAPPPISAPPSLSPTPTPSLPQTYDSAEKIAADLLAGGLDECTDAAPYSGGVLSKGLQTVFCGRGVVVDLFASSAAAEASAQESLALGVDVFLAVGPNWVISTVEASQARQAAEILGGIYAERHA